MFAIMVSEKGGDSNRIEFDKPEVTIGRVQGNDIILPKGNVSKRHSRIVLKDGKFIIVDLKSTNGTYVNGRKITSPLVVKGSDKIYIGDFILTIEDGAAASASADSAAPAADSEPPARKSPTLPPPPPRRTAPPSQAEPLAESAEEAEKDEESGPVAQAAADADDDDDDDDKSDMEETPDPERLSERDAAPPASRPASAIVPPPQPASVASRPTGQMPAQKSPSGIHSQQSRPASVVNSPPPSRPSIPERSGPERSAPASRPASVAPPSSALPAQSPSARVPSSAPHKRVPSAQIAPAGRKITLGDAGLEGKRDKQNAVMRDLGARLVATLQDLGELSEEDLWARAETRASELVDQLVADSALPSDLEATDLIKDVVAEAVGIGPLEDLLSDESVREISIPRHDRVFVDRDGQVSLHGKWISSVESLERIAWRLLQRAGRQQSFASDRASGLVGGRIEGGFVMTAALPPLAGRGAVTLKRTRSRATTLADLAQSGMLSREMADTLEGALKSRRNIVISGGAQTGRSTLLSAMLRALDPSERVILVEQAEEIELGEGLSVQLTTRGGAREAVQNALRLGPDRLVIGDLAGGEAYDFVSAAVSGTDGLIAVVNSSSPRDALTRIESMARLASESPSREMLHEQIPEGIHVVVQLSRAENGLRVTQLSEVSPSADGASVRALHSYQSDGRFISSGHVPRWGGGA